MHPALWFALGISYVITGVALLLVMDSSQRWYAVLDRLTVPQQMVCALLWPVAVPWIIWRLRRG
jgi:hypothetical protein